KRSTSPPRGGFARGRTRASSAAVPRSLTPTRSAADGRTLSHFVRHAGIVRLLLAVLAALALPSAALGWGGTYTAPDATPVRINPPWRALTWGTKRWASYMNVCAKTVSGQLHPGNEGNAYQLNPGEAFAEAYRVLNEQREGIASPEWDLVDPSLRPDATALQL